MNEQYIGTLIMIAGLFVPKNCLPCEGQIINIADNTILYSIIGNSYGGDGVSTFALPDLRGRTPVGVGAKPGGQNYNLGNKGGNETHYLSIDQMPTHNHAAFFTPTSSPVFSVQSVNAGNAGNTTSNPEGKYWSKGPSVSFNPVNAYTDETNIKMADDAISLNLVNNSSVTIGNTGTGESYYQRSPFTAIRWAIVTSGIFPTRQ